MFRNINFLFPVYLITFIWAFYLGVYESLYGLGVYLLFMIQALALASGLIYYLIIRFVIKRKPILDQVFALILWICISLQFAYILAEKFHL